MKKKHIVISNYDDLTNPYYGGGGAIAIHEAAKRLTDTYTITILTGAYPGARNQTIEALQYERIGISFGGPKLGQLLYQFCLPYYVMTKKYDLWIESFTPPFSTGLVPLYTKKPVIGLIHMLSGKDMRRKYRIPFDVIERLGLKTYRHFITTSPVIERTVRGVNKSATVAMIPIGIDIPSTKKTTPGDYMLYLGRVEIDQKGIDLLLKAYQKIQKDTRYKLVLAGRGEAHQVDRLQSLIKRYKLEDSVSYIGHVSGDDKEQLLASARCVIVPSRFETFSLTSLETLASETPLITFSIEGLSWIPEDARVVVPAFSVDALSQAMISFEANTTLTQTRILKGKQFAHTMSWPTIASLYKKYISTMI